MADPDVKVGIDPRTGRDSLHRGDFARFTQGFADGEGADVRVARNPPVELAQKFAAVAGVILPGIFAVENQRQGQRAARVHAFGDGADAAVEVFGGRARVHAAVNEADQIGKIMIAKDAGDFAFAETYSQRRVQAIGIRGHAFAVAAETDIQRAAEHAFVAREPAKAQFGGDGKRVVRDRAFRRPEADGRRAKEALVIGPRANELLAGVFRMAERGAWQRRSGIG